MKKRIRKKYSDCLIKCDHLISENVEVTNDPYPMYWTDEYCRLRDDIQIESCSCCPCKHFFVSQKKRHEFNTCYKHIPQPSISEIREQQRFVKEWMDGKSLLDILN